MDNLIQNDEVWSEVDSEYIFDGLVIGKSYTEKKTVDGHLDAHINIQSDITYIKTKLSESKDEIKSIKEDLNSIQTIVKQIHDDFTEMCNTTTATLKLLKEEIISLKNLNEREKNYCVRSNIPFRFTPDLFPMHSRKMYQ